MVVDTNSNLDPTLHYKLDPGEWGSSAPSSAAFSVGKVAQHEADNVSRFKKQALQKGCYVVSSDVSLNISKQGQYLAATSGKSEVIIYCPKKDDAKSSNNQLQPLSIYDNQIKLLKQQKNYTQNPKEKDKIDQKIQDLKLQKQIMQAILKYSQNFDTANSLDLSA